MRIGLAGLVMISGLVGLIFSLMKFMTPLSGSTGTIGPVLAAIGALSVVAAAILLYGMGPGPARGGIAFLALLAAALTGVAGLFLMAWVVLGAMVFAFVFLLGLVAIRPTSEGAAP